MNNFVEWFKQQVSNPQIVFLTLFLLATVLIVSYAGAILAPVIAGIVIAYVLEGLVGRFTLFGFPRPVAVSFVYLGFIIFVIGTVLVVFPVLYNQMTEMVQQIPTLLSRGQVALMQLPEHYPELISIEQVRELIAAIRVQLTDYGQQLVSISVTGAASIITLMIYLILLPILIFFFVKDKKKILNYLIRFVPKDHELAAQIWRDVDIQVANYVRGKFWEILIVWGVTLAAFAYLGLKYAVLLSFLVGISVLIPYIGAAVVTLPVMIFAWAQWGWSSEFIALVVTYLVIQALDGNLLVPVLFSEAVNLHPVAIIVAVLFFGGLWGLWGVFFAIPLATLVNAIIVAWPKQRKEAVS
ncbi:MAG: AI-2E family transporter [Gammaproteobacteria bacterium]|nr:AI-2E family transporter [Gammaproteobacteria bacterium]MYD75522.1 AI-2E family transporter [Gammaproteobacteria bacterium]